MQRRLDEKRLARSRHGSQSLRWPHRHGMVPLLAAATGASLALAAMDAAGQARGPRTDPGYPARPVRLLVPLAPGGGTDFVARLLAQRLTEGWGQQVVVDNRPGGSAIIATELLAKSSADGHTALLTTMAHAVNPSLFTKLPYDSVKSFQPVILLAQAPSILSAHPSLPATNVKELVALAKAKPGQVSYASFGIGATSHLTSELLKHAAGIDLLHVPYKGAGEANIKPRS